MLKENSLKHTVWKVSFRKLENAVGVVAVFYHSYVPGDGILEYHTCSIRYTAALSKITEQTGLF